MGEEVEYRTPRGAAAMMALLLSAFAGGAVYVALWTSEEDLLNARVRRGGGLVKMVEQTIGWNAFVLLVLGIALLLAIYAVSYWWRAVDGRPDVTIHADRLQFPPAIRPKDALFDEVKSWAIEQVHGAPSIRMMFEQPYWSLQGLVPRKSLKIEGKPALLEPFIEKLVHHPVLGPKRAR